MARASRTGPQLALCGSALKDDPKALHSRVQSPKSTDPLSLCSGTKVPAERATSLGAERGAGDALSTQARFFQGLAAHKNQEQPGPQCGEITGKDDYKSPMTDRHAYGIGSMNFGPPNTSRPSTSTNQDPRHAASNSLIFIEGGWAATPLDRDPHILPAKIDPYPPLL